MCSKPKKLKCELGLFLYWGMSTKGKKFLIRNFCKILIARIGISVEKMPVGTIMGTMYGK